MQLLTVEEVAQLLQVPVRTLYAWRTRQCGPPAIRIGRFLRYEPSAVEQWIADRRQEELWP